MSPSSWVLFTKRFMSSVVPKLGSIRNQSCRGVPRIHTPGGCPEIFKWFPGDLNTTKMGLLFQKNQSGVTFSCCFSWFFMVFLRDLYPSNGGLTWSNRVVVSIFVMFGRTIVNSPCWMEMWWNDPVMAGLGHKIPISSGWWSTYPSEKILKSVGMIIPNIWKVIKFMFQTTNQS